MLLLLRTIHIFLWRVFVCIIVYCRPTHRAREFLPSISLSLLTAKSYKKASNKGEQKIKPFARHYNSKINWNWFIWSGHYASNIRRRRIKKHPSQQHHRDLSVNQFVSQFTILCHRRRQKKTFSCEKNRFLSYHDVCKLNDMARTKPPDLCIELENRCLKIKLSSLN